MLRSLLLLSCVSIGTVLPIAGCGGGGNELVVDLVTDLVPGIELDLVRTELVAGDSSIGGGATAQFNEVAASGTSGLSMGGGRVAEFSGLTSDRYLLRVQAILGGTVVATRSIRVDLSGSTGVTVVISRECRGVVCPEAGDSPAAISCIGGACALPECVTGSEPECAPPQCAIADDCPAAADPCGTPACVDALCIVGLDDTACGEDAVCHPSLGCVGRDECIPLTEICNGLDDDCDDTIDEGFDLTSDPNHCGACGATCGADNAEAVCASGACAVTCNDGFADCNADDSDGCETQLSSPNSCGDCTTVCTGATPLCSSGGDGTFGCASDCAEGTTLCSGGCVDKDTDLAHCGTCDTPCTRPNADPACVGGICGIGSCDPGYGDCAGGESDGCEARLNTLSNCAGCGVGCSRSNATASCASGACRIGSCDAGWGNCDSGDGNGCERNLRTTANCGGCGVGCSRNRATATCATGTCQIGSCDAGWGNCDAGDGNGCETQLNTVTNCGGCGVPCNSLPRAVSESCASGTCRVTSCQVWWDNCDGNEANGCETNVRFNAMHCGFCFNECLGGTSCSNGGCV